MIKFEVGQRLMCRSACDYESSFKGTVIAVTEKMVTVDVENFGIKRVKKYSFDGDDAEICWPIGKFSMAPIFTATRGGDS